ncbi:hypothetical protein E8E14_009582 [Neopestalotiopsis sp. 37M]|nr:hypothetical protein E8E14_009582 [Neopestalotiopsis sp. 37M]
MLVRTVYGVCAVAALSNNAAYGGVLSETEKHRLHDRLYQSTLRGPRLSGSEQANSLVESVRDAFEAIGVSTESLNYTFNRWDPRWWTLEATLRNGSQIPFNTTGYWPYSGNTGAKGYTGEVHDAGSYATNPATQTGDWSSLDLDGLPEGTIAFFDNPSVTRNYSLPNYELWGTSRNISADEIPELGNLTVPRWIFTKDIDFTLLNQKNVSAVILSWVNATDENGALQWPLQDAPPDGTNCPAVWVGNSTGETIRSLIQAGELDTMKVTLDAPTFEASASTLIGHLKGSRNTSESLLLYTHSDGSSAIEENVITTGHQSGNRINQTAWMDERPSIMQNAKAAIVIEHLGAIEWRDQQTPDGGLVYAPTGRMDPMWSLANDSDRSAGIRQAYLDAFDASPSSVRTALLSPRSVNGVRSPWYGVVGAEQLGYSDIPTIGIIPEPDYLLAAVIDGGWSKYDHNQAIGQLEALIRVIETLDAQNSP